MDLLSHNAVAMATSTVGKVTAVKEKPMYVSISFTVAPRSSFISRFLF